MSIKEISNTIFINPKLSQSIQTNDKIKYAIPCAGAQCIVPLQLNVYDILGREVATLVNEEKPVGYYEVDFNASNLSSGCYFYRIITKAFVKTMKMMVVK